MKKFILFILLLIPYPVFAYDLINISDTENIMLEPMQNQYCSTVGGTCEIKLSVSQNYWTTHSLNLNRHNVIIYAPLINVEYHGDNMSFHNFIYKQNDMYNFGTLSLDGINQLYKRYVRVSQTYYDNNKMTFCDINDYSIMCKLEGTQIKEVSFSLFEIQTIEDTRLSGRIAHNAILGNYKNTDSVVNSINNQTQQQQQQNQIINNTDSSGNATDFSNVVNNNTLPNNSHAFDILGGLQGLINGLQPSGSCSRISVPIPFTEQTLILPCMTTDVYSVHFPEIVVIWQLIVRGIAYYYILVNILRLVKETIDPFNFKLEVMDL